MNNKPKVIMFYFDVEPEIEVKSTEKLVENPTTVLTIEKNCSHELIRIVIDKFVERTHSNFEGSLIRTEKNPHGIPEAKVITSIDSLTSALEEHLKTAYFTPYGNLNLLNKALETGEALLGVTQIGDEILAKIYKYQKNEIDEDDERDYMNVT